MEQNYKSPMHKLIKFFEKSRDEWREKAKKRSYENKILRKRIKYLESNRDSLKAKAENLQSDLNKVKTNSRDKKSEDKNTDGKAEKENSEKMIIHQEELLLPAIKRKAPVLEQNLTNHQYSVSVILASIMMVLSSVTSIRSAPVGLETALSFFGISTPMPSWSTVRLWIMRVGYYMLTLSKEKTDDWVWIIDHSVQAGKEKCMVILGVRLSNISRKDKTLTHKDAEVIELFPVQKSNGDIVYEQLETAAKKTGIPRQIVADHGSDIKRGVEKFCLEHKEVAYIYDVNHYCATLLEHELKTDKVWINFKKHAALTKLSLQQTELASLAPPNQRSKARYMNIDVLIAWGSKILWLLEDPDEIKANKINMEKLTAKLGWVREYQQEIIQEWFPMVDAISITKNFVRSNGLFKEAKEKLIPLLDKQNYPARAKELSNKLIEYVEEETAKTKPNEILIGSSELIESIYGKEKAIEGAQSKNGFTGFVLSIPAMVSSISRETVEQAMKTVPVKKLKEWYQENIGASLQSKRKKAFKNYPKKEQIWNQDLIEG